MNLINLFTNTLIGKVSVMTDEKLELGEYVVVESDKGIFVGKVFNIIFDSKDVKCDFSFLRRATSNDLKDYQKNNELADNVLKEVKKIAEKIDLDMSFVDAIYSLDKQRLYISFVADNRIDFRELAKRVAQKYHARIEFRQIGVRDKAKNIGGIGPCGLMLCCNKFLNDFDSVSINMAKNQMLALNPSKINGVCGRLKCCLNYENEVYKEKRKNLPKVGELIKVAGGMAKVIDIDILSRSCKVELPNKNIDTIKFEDN